MFFGGFSSKLFFTDHWYIIIGFIISLRAVMNGHMTMAAHMPWSFIISSASKSSRVDFTALKDQYTFLYSDINWTAGIFIVVVLPHSCCG